MKVKQLIENLKEFDQEAEIVSITATSEGWDYTSEPKISESKNSWGKRVWIN